MLVIKYGNSFQPHVVTWHLGDKLVVVNIGNIVEVRADNEELDYINQRFANMPQVAIVGGVDEVKWYGDHARFIVGNLEIPNDNPAIPR